MANPNPTPRPGNLTHFKPGQSGNPGGRPKILTISDAVRAALGKKVLMGSPLPFDLNGVEALGEAIVYHAITGMAAYANIALDRTEGKVPDAPPEIVGIKQVQERMAAYLNPDDMASGSTPDPEPDAPDADGS